MSVVEESAGAGREAAELPSSLESLALQSVRAAALAAAELAGLGDKDAADGAATEAMREVLSGATGRGKVIIGEGEKDNAPMLYNGEELAKRLRAMGVHVIMPSAGDVAGAMFALLPGTGVDMLMGIGGTPEGIMAACAVKVLGGGMQTRLAPQRDDEAEAIAEAGISTDEILEVEDLIRGPAIFAACGITGGTLLDAPRRPTPGWISTHSLIISPGSYRRIVERTPEADGAEA